MKQLQVILIKPSKYGRKGEVERFKTGFMPNATLYHISALTPNQINGVPVSVKVVDEYVHQNLGYLDLLHSHADEITVVALVGVQSHQFQRALDLAAYALKHGVRHVVVGGPHPMTCDTSDFHGRGVSFALAEAELVWPEILCDAIEGELKSVYGTERRWAESLPDVIVSPPDTVDLGRYWAPMLGLYPVRGCPYRCNFCSVIKISGRQVRSPEITSVIESLRRAKRGGVETIMFVSDNFNKYPRVRELLEAIIAEKLNLRFFCQCDTQIAKDPELVDLLGRAGCFEMFVGVESFSRTALKAVTKLHNDPRRYADIVDLCSSAGIRPHFSNIIGFPDDDLESIENHLEVLKALQPKVASFFILTPIPGTEQYDEYRRTDLIFESNLDRFDATTLTWRHPNLSADQLLDSLYACYTKFHGHILRTNKSLTPEDQRIAIFNRFTAAQRMHPMAGGIDKLRLDTADDYRSLRRATYDIDMAPLPSSLRLTEHDELLNRHADWRQVRSGATA